MELSDFIKSGNGLAKALSLAMHVPMTYISQMASGNRPVSPERAVLLEQLTGGMVGRLDTRPDDWWLIWPELAARHPRLVPVDYRVPDAVTPYGRPPAKPDSGARKKSA